MTCTLSYMIIVSFPLIYNKVESFHHLISIRENLTETFSMENTFVNFPKLFLVHIRRNIFSRRCFLLWSFEKGHPFPIEFLTVVKSIIVQYEIVFLGSFLGQHSHQMHGFIISKYKWFHSCFRNSKFYSLICQMYHYFILK